MNCNSPIIIYICIPERGREREREGERGRERGRERERGGGKEGGRGREGEGEREGERVQGEVTILIYLFLLPVSPDSSHCLIIISRVPVRIKHYQTIGSDQVEATPTSFTTQHEYKVAALRHTHK